ncbi:winged helix-turn-helix transcriptional regulator [Candidatus Daviesbacteria bacterium]|nr:winged helix-turn-helix transcriptional regulator [Candidatus Daviesbacteria bacterium]
MFNRSYIKGHEGHPHYITDSKVASLQKKVSFLSDEEKLLRIVKNLSDPTKLRIYLLLHKVKEIPVTDITQILNMSQSAVSHALSDLKNLGLVESHRCGQLICYSLVNGKKSEAKPPYYVSKFLSFFDRFK